MEFREAKIAPRKIYHTRLRTVWFFPPKLSTTNLFDQKIYYIKTAIKLKKNAHL